MDENLDKALIEVISKISQHFGPRAVLKGGMSLRLQGISRSTMDADFCFQPSNSKKDFTSELIELLNQICDKPVQHSMDSKKIKIDGLYLNNKITIEANSHKGFEPQAISTAHIARRYSIPSSIISILPNPMGFSHKLGAWLDRRLSRDLYDIYVYLEILRSKPDPSILEHRIRTPSYTRQVKSKPELRSIEEFICFLKSECDQINHKGLEEDLSAIIPESELMGLGENILRSIRKIVNFA